MDSRLETLKSITTQIKKIIQYSKNPKLTDTLNRVLRRLLESQRFLMDRQDATGKTLTAKKIGFYILKTYRMTQERSFNNVLMKYMPGQYRMVAALFARLDKLAREFLSFDYKQLRKAEADVGIIHGYLVRAENAFRSASQMQKDRQKAAYLHKIAGEMRIITAMIYLGRNPDKSICGFEECVERATQLGRLLENLDFPSFLPDTDPRIINRLVEIQNNYYAAFRNYIMRKFTVQRKTGTQTTEMPLPDTRASNTVEVPVPQQAQPQRTPQSPGRGRRIPIRASSANPEQKSVQGRIPIKGQRPVMHTSQLQNQPVTPGQRSYPPAQPAQQVPKGPRRGSIPQSRSNLVAGKRPQQHHPQGQNANIRQQGLQNPGGTPMPPTTVLRSAQSTRPLRVGPDNMPIPPGAPAGQAGGRPQGFFREVNRQRPDLQKETPRTPLTHKVPRPRSFEDEVISLLDKSKRSEVSSRMQDPKTTFLNPDVLKKPRSFLSEAIQNKSSREALPTQPFSQGGPPEPPQPRKGPAYHRPGQEISMTPPRGMNVPPAQKAPTAPMAPAGEENKGISIAEIVKKSKEQSQPKKPGCLPAFMGGGAAILFIIIRIVQFFLS